MSPRRLGEDDVAPYIDRPRGPHAQYVLPFTPPVAFYRQPSSSAIGITEALDVWKGDVAIDPLVGEDWREFVLACRARERSVYAWTRVWDKLTWDEFTKAAWSLDGYFPNIEDDDLRGSPSLPGYVASTTANLMGVLSNYFVSDEWPDPNPLGHLPVLPEWFPREITDATATLEGSLDSGRRHFAAALPLLDGRERGLEAFPYPAGAYAVWPADNVTDWKAWLR